MALNETNHALEFLLSEAAGARSRDEGALLSGENLQAGAVLGKIAVGSASSAAKSGGNTGNGTMGAVTVGAGAQVGVYQLRVTKAATNAGDFQVTDPQGDVIGVGSVGVAFSGGGLSFTLSDGATDFAVGDGFDITVAEGSLKYVELDPVAANGSQIAVAILATATDATSGDQDIAVFVRGCEVADVRLTWPTGISAGQKTAAIAALATQGIIVR